MPGLSVRVFDSYIIQGFLCLKCVLVLNKPHQITECGHLYCEDCLKEITSDTKSTGKRCVVKECGASVEKVEKHTFLDRAIQRDVWKLPVLCDYEECDWTGNLKYLIDVHRQECKFRSIKCDLCNQLILIGKMKGHQKDCLKTPVVCPDCLDKLPRQKLFIHCQETCVNRKMFCKFEPFGCEVKANKKDIVDHYRDSLPDHVKMVHNRIKDIEQAVSSLLTASPSSESENPQEKCAYFENTLSELSKSCAELEVDSQCSQSKKQKPDHNKNPLSVSKDFINELEIKLNNLEAQSKNFPTLKIGVDASLESTKTQIETYEEEKSLNRERIKQLSRQLMQIETQVMLRDQALQEKRNLAENLEKATFNGVLVWRIDNFAQRRQDAVSGRTLSFYSHYFYSGRFGYKMRARIYLNGDGQGKGSHISIFFVVCNGEYDAIQRWPFQHKITMSIMDQGGKQHVTDAFRPNPKSPSFQRPKTPMNVASGIPQFMPMSQVLDTNQSYVKEDTMFVKVTIDLY